MFSQCRDNVRSWIFLFIGLLATISLRLVTLVMHLGQFWPKFFWYIGVSGFFVYFLYKYRQDKSLRAGLLKSGIVQRVSGDRPLEAGDYEFLRGMFCRMRSTKDSINYFFIFLSSGLVLCVALYQDVIKKLITH